MDTQGFSAAERLERLPISGYHRIIFIIIALAFFFDSMDLAMMTFLLGSIKAEFGLSSAQAGLLASSSFFGMVLGASLSGMLADRFGRKPVFQWSIVLWGVASYLCSTAQTVETLTLFRILLGIGMGMEFPIAQSMLSELIPAQAARALHRLDGRLLAAGFCRGRRAVVFPAAADWLARHLSGVGGAGGVCAGDPFFHSRIAALAGTGRACMRRRTRC